MTQIALDLNATRVRAMIGSSPADARPLPLEDNLSELPLALNLESKYPQPGRIGLAVCRRSPHLSCINFLPHLGEGRSWSGPRQKIDALEALTLVLESISSRGPRHQGVALATPGYLTAEQQALVRRAAGQARLKVLLGIDAALAAALAAQAQQPWRGTAIVVDVDDHALTWSAVAARADTARLLQSNPQTTLGILAWKERLLGMIADAIVRKSRRDPRDSAEAEQELYDQLEAALQNCLDLGQAEVALHSPQWQQSLLLVSQDLINACRPLLDRALQSFRSLWDSLCQREQPSTIVMTPVAARLPGLVPALELHLAELAPAEALDESDDFGAGLVQEAAPTPANVQVLAPDAVGLSLLELCLCYQRIQPPQQHLDAAPLPRTQSPDQGLPRLHFRGHDHPLAHAVFTLGRDPSCDMVFETSEFPSVSARHCEIVSDNRCYVVRDHSRHGTLVNDRRVVQQRVLHAGDWIRLGPGGPLLRFLGQPMDRKNMMPTA